MKKWQIILATVLGLILTLTPIVAMAQSDTSAKDESRLAFKGALAIVAPRLVAVDKEMSLGVFVRANQESVKDAWVWAVPKDDIEALKSDVKAVREESGANASEADYRALLEGRAIFLGQTGGNGKLTYTFTKADDYLLVAFKQGYFPGFSGLRVKNMPRFLGVSAPKRAVAGSTITVQVFQRGNHDPVKDADVWAVSSNNLADLKIEIAEAKEANQANIQDVDWEAIVKGHAVWLGKTKGNGELKCSIDEPGHYALVAIERGYIPGYTGIAIVTPKVSNNNTATGKTK